MKTAKIKSSWIGLHPTNRMDAGYWISVVEAMERAGVDPDTASDADVRLAMTVADAPEQPIMLAKFPLGQIVATPSALAAVPGERIKTCLAAHAMGDWGCVDAEDKRTNDDGLKSGNRLLSAYAIDVSQPCRGFGNNCLWIITERDRSVTTILLPDEY